MQSSEYVVTNPYLFISVDYFSTFFPPISGHCNN